MSRVDSSGNFLVPLFRRIAELLEKGDAAVLASVVGAQGSTPGRLCMKMLVCRDGEIIGTVGGGGLEGRVIEAAREVMEGGAPRRLRLSLNPERCGEAVGICGGDVEVFVEPIGVHTVYLFGGGHVAHAVSRFAAGVGFRLVVFDDREEFATPERFPDAGEIHVGPYEETFAHVRPGPYSYLCLVTRGHASDEGILELAVRDDHRYVGMIGSRNKIRTVLDNLRARGADEERLRRVRAPIGVDIGATTPAEIGLSIVAELIREKYRGLPAGGDPGARP